MATIPFGLLSCKTADRIMELAAGEMDAAEAHLQSIFKLAAVDRHDQSEQLRWRVTLL